MLGLFLVWPSETFHQSLPPAAVGDQTDEIRLGQDVWHRPGEYSAVHGPPVARIARISRLSNSVTFGAG